MSRLTFDDLTPDDMPAPFVDDSGDRADSYRDALLDCGAQTTEAKTMSTPDANTKFSPTLLLPLTARRAIHGYALYDANESSLCYDMQPGAAREIAAICNSHNALVAALDDVLTVFRECIGDAAFSEFAGTSDHGPQVRSHRIVDALALLKTARGES